MKALVIRKPREAAIESLPEPILKEGEISLRVRMVCMD